MHIVRNHFALKPRFIGSLNFSTAAPIHIERIVKRLSVLLDVLGEHRFSAAGVFVLSDRFSLVLCPDLRDGLAGHIDRVGDVLSVGMLCDLYFIRDFRIVASVSIEQSLEAVLLLVFSLAFLLHGVDGDFENVADLGLHHIPVFILLFPLAFPDHNSGDVAGIIRLGNFQKIFDKLDGILDGSVFRAEVPGNEQGGGAVALVDGHFAGLFLSVVVDVHPGDLFRQLVAFLSGQGDRLAGGRIADLGLAAGVGLDLVQRRDEHDLDDDLLLIFIFRVDDDVPRDGKLGGTLSGADVFLAFCFSVDVIRIGLLGAVLGPEGYLDLGGQGVFPFRLQIYLFAGGDVVGKHSRAAGGHAQDEGIIMAMAVADHGLVCVVCLLLGIGNRVFFHGLRVLARTAVAGIGLGAGAGGGIVVRVALGVLGAGCGGLDLLVVHSPKRQIVRYLDICRPGIGEAVDDHLGLAVHDGHRHAAGDADALRACARDGFGADHMLAGHVFRLQLHVQPVGQGVDRAGGQRQAGCLHGSLDLGLHLLREASLGDEGDERIQIKDIVGHVLQQVGGQRSDFGEEVIADRFLQLGPVHHRMVGAGNRGLHDRIQPFERGVDGRLLQAVQRAGKHVADHGVEDVAVEVLAAHTVLDRLQEHVAQRLDRGRQDLFADFPPRIGEHVHEGVVERLADQVSRVLFSFSGRSLLELLEGAFAHGGVHDGADLFQHLLRDRLDLQVGGRQPFQVFILGEAFVRNRHQSLKAGAFREFVSQFLNDVGNDLGNAAADHAAVLGQTHFDHQVFQRVGQNLCQFFKECGTGGLFPVPFVVVPAFVLDDRLHVQGVGDNDRVADPRDVFNVQDVDRNRDADADVALGGGRVRLDLAHRPVQGDHVDAAVHADLVGLGTVLRFQLRRAHRDDLRAAVDLRLRGVILNVQHEARGHGHAAFTGLRALAVAVGAHDAAGVHVVAAVHAGQSRAAADHAVRLAIRAAAAAVIRGAFRAGLGGALQRAGGFRADIDAVRADALLQLRQRAVVQDRDVEGTAGRRLAARRAGIRGGHVARFVLREHDSRLHVFLLRNACQFVLRSEGEDRILGFVIGYPDPGGAQIGLRVRTGDVQRENRRDGYAAARGTSLGGNAVRHGLLRRNADAAHIDDVQVAIHGHLLVCSKLLADIHIVFHRRHGVRAGDRDRDARAYAGGRGLGAGSIRVGREVHRGTRRHVQHRAFAEADLRRAGGSIGAVIQFFIEALVNLRVGLGR